MRAIRPSGTVMLYGALGGPSTTVPTLDLLYAVSLFSASFLCAACLEVLLPKQCVCSHAPRHAVNARKLMSEGNLPCPDVLFWWHA